MSAPEGLRRALREAQARLGGSVTWINPEAAHYAAGIEPIRVGIKDTEVIPVEIARRLTGAPGYLWLTLDRSSPGGRAIDPGLLNPLTCRPMTGSSSGGAVNVLEGINDLAIGTDGGGSVLGPAMACNLYGILGSGLGLVGPGSGLSTDGRVFTPGLGLLARELAPAYRALDLMLDQPLATPLLDPDRRATVLATIPRVQMPAPGSLVRPDGLDMWAALAPARDRLHAAGIAVEPVPMADAHERSRALEILEAAGPDLLLTLEGPVDWYGLGDSVLGSLGGPAAEGQARSGKYLLRAANMVGATAVTIPVGLPASGMLVVGPQGRQGGLQALAVASLLEGLWPTPELLTRYFGPGRRSRPGFPRPEANQP